MNIAPSMSFANRLSVNRLLPPIPDKYIQLYSALFVVSIFALTIRYFVSDSFLSLTYLLEIASCITCGIAWLLSRGLFKPPGSRATWPAILIACLFVFSVILYISDHLGASRDGIFGFLGSVNSLIGSAVIVLPILEALDGLNNQTNQQERRFRMTFLTGYGFLIAISLILAIPDIEFWGAGTRLTLSWIALAAGMSAVWYRLNHPQATANQRKHRHPNSLSVDPTLGPKILETLQSERIFLDSQIKVIDLARLLKQPDYKVTQAITNDLAFRNFNQMMNQYRIQEAKRLLSEDKFSHYSILSIAMNSGFGSIGPFNRAFKEQTGMTPKEFRKSQ